MDEPNIRLIQQEPTGECMGVYKITQVAYLGRKIPAQTTVRESLAELVAWMRWNTSPTDPNSPHEMLVRAVAALEKEADRE